MELTFAQQSTAFLCSLVFGAAAGLLYDIFKIIRMTLCKGKASVFVTDFLYVFIVSLNLFIFSVAYMLGFFRVFVTVGSFLGFVICRLTLGRLLSLVYCPMIRFTESVCVKISQKIKKNLKKLLKNSNNILYNEGKNKGIFRNDNNNSAEKADSFEDEKKHKESKRSTAASRQTEDGAIKEITPKKRKKGRYILIYLAIIGFVFYAVITIINQNVQIAEKKAELTDLQQQISVVEIQSQYLKKVQNYKGDDLKKYIEKIAKDELGYVGDGERIFINVAGE